MKVGILGSGNVGQALAKGSIAEGHDVYLATREPDGDKATELKNEMAEANITDFESAAKEAQLVILCTPWSAAKETIGLAGSENLSGKIVIDANNNMTQENGLMVYAGTADTSAGEQVQAWLPDSHVVKCLNTVGAALMYKPDFETKPTMFIAGENAEAKEQVSDIAEMFGWEAFDAGGIIASRQLENMVVLWVNNAMSGHPHSAFKMLS